MNMFNIKVVKSASEVTLSLLAAICTLCLLDSKQRITRTIFRILAVTAEKG